MAFPKIYFHGSPKDYLEKVLSQGLQVQNGRATFSTNPLFTLKYGTYRFENSSKNIGETILYMVENDRNIKPALESDIDKNPEKKLISGWPNRYRANAFGYYLKEKSGVIPAELMIGAVVFSEALYDSLLKLENRIKDGTLGSKEVEKAKREIVDIIGDKKNLVFKIMIDLKRLSSAMIDGLLNQTLQSLIRKTELSVYASMGWRIKNNGDHPVPIFKTKKEIEHSLSNINKIIAHNYVWSEAHQDIERLKQLFSRV